MVGNDLALALWTAQRYAEAIGGYRQTLELEPDFVESRRGLGLLHAFLGDFDAALPVREGAVTLMGMWNRSHASERAGSGRASGRGGCTLGGT